MTPLWDIGGSSESRKRLVATMRSTALLQVPDWKATTERVDAEEQRDVVNAALGSDLHPA